MQIAGEALLRQQRGDVKFIANETGIFIFPSTNQHRDMQLGAIRYADESTGNAVAGIIQTEKVEIRHHQNFSPDRVANLWKTIAAHPSLQALKGRRVLYGGKALPATSPEER